LRARLPVRFLTRSGCATGYRGLYTVTTRLPVALRCTAVCAAHVIPRLRCTTLPLPVHVCHLPRLFLPCLPHFLYATTPYCAAFLAVTVLVLRSTCVACCLPRYACLCGYLPLLRLRVPHGYERVTNTFYWPTVYVCFVTCFVRRYVLTMLIALPRSFDSPATLFPDSDHHCATCPPLHSFAVCSAV